ncbi:MAG: Imm52 family immunity protein [Polyangiaceae bacterium]
MNRVELAIPALGVMEVGSILLCMADVLDPDWGFAGSELFPANPAPDRDDITVGWMTYLSDRLGPMPAILAPARVAKFGRGSLVIALPERFVDDDAAHLAAVDHVRRTLFAAPSP